MQWQVFHLALNKFELKSQDMYLIFEQHQVKPNKTN